MCSKAAATILNIIIMCSTIVWGILISLQLPFFPTEAEKKGAKAAQYGFVFGISNLAAFINSVLIGWYGLRVGAKRLYYISFLIGATSATSFAFVTYADNTAVFLGLSYLIRFVQGSAGVVSWNAILSIALSIYPEQKTIVFAIIETLFAFGYMIGPVFGSLLYDVGGFSLPFLVDGAVMLVLSIAVFLVVPDVKQCDRDSSRDDSKNLNIRGILKSPCMILVYLDVFICITGNGMIESMLEPHLKRKAMASQAEVGVSFFILGGVYMAISPIGGWISQGLRYPTILSIVGNSANAIAFLFFGPVPFILADTNVSTIQMVAALFGFGYGILLSSSFKRITNITTKLGYEDNANTNIAITSVWTLSFFLGNSVGSTLSGFLVDAYGFQWTTVVFFAFYCIMLVVDVFELLFNVNLPMYKPSYERVDVKVSMSEQQGEKQKWNEQSKLLENPLEERSQGNTWQPKQQKSRREVQAELRNPIATDLKLLLHGKSKMPKIY